MRRRQFVTLLGGAAAAWPVAAWGQQSVIPVIGFLSPTSPDGYANRLRAFRQGLKEAGIVEGETVAIEYRWAENRIDRLAALAAELVSRKVAVIATVGGAAPALAAKAATTTIPIIFNTGEDPVKSGLVTSIARPSGNLTGINFISTDLNAKRLELLRELVPTARRIALLINPAGPTAEITLNDTQAAAYALGLQIEVIRASNNREITAVFATLVRERPDALFVSADPFLTSRRVQVVHLATFHRIPAAYTSRENTEAGGLMSYGSDISDSWRHVGVYCGRTLKGVKPADLPVLQASKFELVINAETARMLGITVPPMLLARADEVIE